MLSVCACLAQWHERTQMHALFIDAVMVQTWCAIDNTSHCCALHILSWLDPLVPSGIHFAADRMLGLKIPWTRFLCYTDINVIA